MPNYRIFTESPADIKFLKDYIEETFATSLSYEDFDSLGSWAGYKSGGDIKASIKQNKEDNKTTILILDADNDFAARQNEVINDFAKEQIPIQLFLFPNNKSIGSLESLLCEIAIVRNIIDCFEAYETCITGHQAPVLKSKVFAYLDALLPEKNKKTDKNDLIHEKNRNYRNKAHWNLNHIYLDPLKHFLSNHIL
jgi:hypothetical protein